MGYEVLLVVGTYSRDMKWFSTIGTIDLCKVGYNGQTQALSDKSHKKGNGYDGPTGFWPHCGRKNCTDLYGDKMWFVPIKEVIQAIEADNKNEPYRRFKVALKFLNQVRIDFKKENAGCLFWGH